jgi:acetate kinase
MVKICLKSRTGAGGRIDSQDELMDTQILCINAGSSSLKFSVYQMSSTGSADARVVSGAVEAIGQPTGRFWMKGNDDRRLCTADHAFSNHIEAVEAMVEGLEQQGRLEISAIGHRIVHGGPYFSDPLIVDRDVRARLDEIVPYAPLHLPTQIGIIDQVSKRRPDLPQVACFDTAFHRPMPELAKRFALPRELYDQGIRRYGFHGLSYEFVTSKLGPKLGRRAIIAHLGNGASMVALQDGRPIDTSMGLTPTGGFMMSTRSGDLDPGVLVHLQRRGWTAEQLEAMLDRSSGLAGVSSLSSDMKTLLETRANDLRAAEAVAMFCYQARKTIGAYAAALGGLDTLVFTGGIGERAAEVRAEICDGLGFLGIVVDRASNARDADVISAIGGTCVVRVAQTDEDLMIARHTCDCIAARRLKNPQRTA